jgi:tetratricopeptide (TPR) repeat protein
MKVRTAILVTLILLVIQTSLMGQTVFSVMQDPVKQANKYYDEGDLPAAINLYNDAIERGAKELKIRINLARAQYHTRDYIGSVSTYEWLASQAKNEMTLQDLLLYADAKIILKHHDDARALLKQYLQKDPDNDLVAKKLWRLDNLKFMYEDSAHFAVSYMPINTTASELCATSSGQHLVFASNRKGIRPLDQVGDKESASFYRMYTLEITFDSLTRRFHTGETPERFASSLHSLFHTGPVAFYNEGKKMVFVSSSPKALADGYRHLGLYFASLKESKWQLDFAFPYNSDTYSITDVAINDEGTVLYFSSGMKGGFGGKDIYKSTLVDGKWSKPLNAGDPVNTVADEVFPYLYRNATLYFSSNGHPGMGGLDMFKSAILDDGYSEPDNLGYPMNSSHDDFAFTLDSTSTHGYFTSNRKRGGFDDDVYEFNMDMQTYPFDITGLLRSKQHTWSAEHDIVVWPGAKMSLIDSWHNKTVATTTSGDDGSFSFSIPYFSRYHIAVLTEEGATYIAGLELEKYRKDKNAYEIVIVKDIFTTTNAR